MSIDALMGVWVPEPPLAEGASGVETLVVFPGTDGLGVSLQWVDAEGRRGVWVADAAPWRGVDQPGAWFREEGEVVTIALVGPGGAAEAIALSPDGAALIVRGGRDPEGALRREEGRFTRGEVKQVIAYRRDLNMRKGKIAAQCAHASMKVFLDRDRARGPRLDVAMTPAMALWVRRRMAKVVLSVEDEPALLAVYDAARRRGLPVAMITDAGRTEFRGVPTRTTVAVGPAPAHEIDAITGPGGLVPTKLA
jgi:PTH2 family peptidyl-tRNA hydrolase